MIIRYIFTFLLVSSQQSKAFLQPEFLFCTSKEDFLVILQNKPSLYLKKGTHRLNLEEIVSIKIIHSAGPIAKLFPQHGLDGILFNSKNYFLYSDNQSYWSIHKKKSFADEVFRCETRP